MSSGYAVEASAVPKQKQRTKMNFIKRWLLRSVKDAVEQEKDYYHNSPATLISKGPQSIDQPERAIQFTVYHANGGRVIETRRYERKTDRNTNGLYIITSDQDFGKEIDKIITMESLK